MTVRQLLNSIDARELAEWTSYFQIEGELAQKAQQSSKPVPMEMKMAASMKKYKRR